jgi:hypothetical protein
MEKWTLQERSATVELYSKMDPPQLSSEPSKEYFKVIKPHQSMSSQYKCPDLVRMAWWWMHNSLVDHTLPEQTESLNKCVIAYRTSH